MVAVGTIVEILSSTLVLIASDADFDEDDVLVVFGELKQEKLAEKYGLDVVQFPKGRVSIVAKQKPGFYIAETFRPIIESQIVEKTPGILSGLFPTEVIKKRTR